MPKEVEERGEDLAARGVVEDEDDAEERVELVIDEEDEVEREETVVVGLDE